MLIKVECKPLTSVLLILRWEEIQALAAFVKILIKILQFLNNLSRLTKKETEKGSEKINNSISESLNKIKELLEVAKLKSTEGITTTNNSMKVLAYLFLKEARPTKCYWTKK